MKFDKMLDIWKTMDIQETDREEMLNIIQFLDRFVRREGLDFYLEKPGKDMGILSAAVYDERGRMINAQIKVWDNEERKLQKSTSLRRVVTDNVDRTVIGLPVGTYYIDVTCGQEYSCYSKKINVAKENVILKDIKLKRIINLGEEGWYTGDLHHHSIYSSPVFGGTDPVIESPFEVKTSMKALGMTFGALSDHHNVKNHKEWSSLKDENFVTLISKEISTSNGHVLSLGVNDDVIYNVPDKDSRTKETLLAEFERIVNEIKQKGGLPQLNHPFDFSTSTSFNKELWDYCSMFESIEIWNGATPFDENSINYKSFRKWMELLEEGTRLTATAGSDTHNISGDDYFGMIEWMAWLMQSVHKCQKLLPEELRSKAYRLQELYSKYFDKFAEWVGKSNSPSNVCNYVNAGKNAGSKELLNAIRAGKVFISNGPILIPEIDGKGISETAMLKSGKANVHIKLISKKDIREIKIYTGADKYIIMNTKVPEEKLGAYIYDFEEECDLQDASFAVFTAGEMPDFYAITNPIFIQKAD